VSRALPLLRWLLGLAIVLFAGSVLWQQSQSLSIAQLRTAWSDTSLMAIAASVFGTGLSFACLAGYEWFATSKVVPRRVPPVLALRVGAMSHAISNTLGFHALTASACRYRGYRTLGLGAIDVAKVVAAVGVCVAIGVVAVSAIALLWLQLTAGRLSLVLPAAAVLLLVVALVHRAEWIGPLRTSIILRNAAWLSLLGAIEMIATIGALYVLMPAAATPAFAPFVLLFVTAMVLGIISHAPGGIGVFEASILAAMPAESHAHVLVALLTYRSIYNLLPFAVAMIALLVQWLRTRHNSASV
jgi:uncharacterized membrane protein YbhN (UPF0104 family)